MDYPDNPFSSMEEVDEYLSTMKTLLKDDEATYKTLCKVLGRGEQEGDSVHVEGIGEIDRSIAEIIKCLNDKGYRTLSSCSGLKSEHLSWSKSGRSYLFIEDDGRGDYFLLISRRINASFEYKECYFKKAYSIYYEGSDDESISLFWRKFFDEIKNL